MHVRVDAETSSARETAGLGIAVGDYVCFDPRFEATDTGFVKSRFLDDKAGAAVMLEVLERLGPKLARVPAAFVFSTYEEVGHGGSAGLPPSAKEILPWTWRGGQGRGGPGDRGLHLRQGLQRPPGLRACAAASRPWPGRSASRTPWTCSPSTAPTRPRPCAPGTTFGPGSSGPGLRLARRERTHVKGLLATADLVEAYVRSLA